MHPTTPLAWTASFPHYTCCSINVMLSCISCHHCFTVLVHTAHHTLHTVQFDNFQSLYTVFGTFSRYTHAHALIHPPVDITLPYLHSWSTSQFNLSNKLFIWYSFDVSGTTITAIVPRKWTCVHFHSLIIWFDHFLTLDLFQNTTHKLIMLE